MRYMRGLRYIWWNKGNDDLLSFFPLWFVTIPLILVVSIIQTFHFTFCYIRKSGNVHPYYIEMLDPGGGGIYKCHLHDSMCKGICGREIIW